ncbi:zinc c3hc4 type [Stylonychia lemnae]|uniref:Zinc c3hc4 type n=1 Tax=Stylonychia lemnae TaxID=5949 RepID=A0A078A2N4_STYLE|nr:zinc c3hc4 type [Stylonychia lemnae]|eukprot:CDW76350.1 zinc c3hc4 type [Stylonychia lemnae]
MCKSKLMASLYTIVVICESLSKIQIYRKNDLSLIKEIVLPPNSSFVTNQISDNQNEAGAFLISRNQHIMVFYQVKIPLIDPQINTQNQNKPSIKIIYQVYMLDIIFNNDMSIMNHNLEKPELIYSSEANFQMNKIYDNFIIRQDQNDSLTFYQHQVCYYDQYMLKKQCLQCPPKSYSLSFKDETCYFCVAINTYYLLPAQKTRLIFLCDNYIKHMSDRHNFYLDSFDDQLLIPINSENQTNFTVINQEGLKIDGWEIALIITGCLITLIISTFMLILVLKKKRNPNTVQIMASSQSIIEPPQQENLNPEELVKTKIEQIEKLSNEKLYKDINEIDKTQKHSCVICLEEFKDQNLVRTTQCLHLFHSKCFHKWISSQLRGQSRQNQDLLSYCPTCKHNLLEQIDRQVQKTQEPINPQLNDAAVQYQINYEQRTDQNQQQKMVQMINNYVLESQVFDQDYAADINRNPEQIGFDESFDQYHQLNQSNRLQLLGDKREQNNPEYDISRQQGYRNNNYKDQTINLQNIQIQSDFENNKL